MGRGVPSGQRAVQSGGRGEPGKWGHCLHASIRVFLSGQQELPLQQEPGCWQNQVSRA